MRNREIELYRFSFLKIRYIGKEQNYFASLNSLPRTSVAPIIAVFRTEPVLFAKEIEMNKMAPHSLFRQIMRAEADSFQKEMKDAPAVQARILTNILHKSRDTIYGRKYCFETLRGYEEFREGVPITSYEDYIPFLETLHNGDQGVLGADPVLRFHLSSGTSSCSKYIPFTHGLAREFQRAIAPWLSTMYDQFPTITNGYAFWALTPPLEIKEEKLSALPIGFDSEEAYFSLEARACLSSILIDLRTESIKDPDAFFFRTLQTLIHHEDLTWLSAWSPTYILVLWEKFLLFGETLLQGKERVLSRADCTKIAGRIALAQEERRFDILWPNLKVVSCWRDAWASIYHNDIKKLFPTVFVERKGLMATEGVVTIPWEGSREGLSPLLAYRSHFYEFLSVTSSNISLPHDLIIGHEYEVLLTTSGGFYRYRLGDIVRCDGFEGSIPRLSFCGRSSAVSDMCGEKLNEYHVQRSVDEAFRAYSVVTRYYFLAADDRKRQYILVVEPRTEEDRQNLQFKESEILNLLDKRLRSNVHYDYCRNVSQLRMPRTQIVQKGYWRQLVESKSKEKRLGVLKTTSFGNYSRG